MLGEVAIEHGLSLSHGFGFGQSQFTRLSAWENYSSSIRKIFSWKNSGLSW